MAVIRLVKIGVEVDIETPDLARIKDRDYAINLLDIYQRKYRDARPDLIMTTYTPATQFLLDYGEKLFPGIPVVFCAADSKFVAAQRLAPHFTGITTHRDIAGTLELALHVHPGTQRVAVIVASSAPARALASAARQALQSFAGRVELMWLPLLPLAELTEAIGKLPDRTVILYLVSDRHGTSYALTKFVEALSPVTNAPIYGLWETLLGHGIIGGRMAAMEDDAFQAAQMGLRILRGESPAAIPVVDRQQNRATFDAIELARWNVDEDRLPADSRIVYRQPSVWDDYRTEIMAAGLVIGLQGLLIVALLLNRARLHRTRAVLRNEYERRRQAEDVAFSLQRRLVKFSRQRTLGAMATGIAHEINQPLIAIQNYAQALRQRLRSHVDQRPKLLELLEKIEYQAARAGDTIQSLRNLVTTNSAKLRPVSLYFVLGQVIQMVEPDIKSRGYSIDWRPGADHPVVLIDTLEIQLVLVNLLQNAVQSMEYKGDKVVSIETRRIDDQTIQISIADRGPGIDPERIEDIFEPLYSGNGEGMGMGLAICRIIVEAHGGHIGYRPNPSGGAIFQFTVRLAAA